LGKKIDELINKKGVLVPDEIATEVVRRFLSEDNLKRGIIFDGYPRTKKQLGILKRLLRERSTSVDQAIYLDASEGVINQRLSGRLICPRCEKNYHITNMPPKKTGICDICGVDIRRRKDDNPKAIKKRLAIYHQETAPLIKIYRKMGILEEINGDDPPGVVFKEILSRLKKAGLIK